MTSILHLDPSSAPRNGSGQVMPYAVLTLLRAGTDEILEEYTADADGVFETIIPDFSTYTYRVQLRDQAGVLRYDVLEYKPAYANYVDACSQRLVSGEILSGMEFEFTASGNPVNIYADADLLASLPNPLKADASGLLPPIYKAPGAYTMEWDSGAVEFSGLAFPVVASLAAVAAPASAGVSGTGTSQTTDSITIIPSGGDSPYAYAWVWHTGGSGISITSASTQSTTFSSSGLSNPETRSGTVRCTVTDSVGATTYVDVAVVIAGNAEWRRNQSDHCSDKHLADIRIGSI
jgi:hypothetical protein